MSFQIKYDKNKNVIPDTEYEKNAAVIEAAPITQPEPQETLQEEVIQEPEVAVEEPVVKQAEQQAEQKPEPKQETPAQRREMNMRAAWDKAEKAERERDELQRKLQQFESNKAAQQQAQQPQEEDLDVNLGNDDIAEGKHISKIDKKIKKLENLIKQQNQWNELNITRTRLQTQFPDFYQVVNEENIQTLKHMEPELYNTLNTNPDPYSAGVASYKIMKKLNMAPDTSYDADKERIQKNAAKPRTLTSLSPQTGSNPLQQANVFANGLTEDLKKQLYKEMQAAIKNRNQ